MSSTVIIKSKKATVLKQSIVQSSGLTPSETMSIKEGTSLEISSYLPLLGTNHTVIHMSTPVLGSSLWIVYDKHWDLFDPTSAEIILPVPYLTQRDNKYAPGSTCNLTCVAMILQFYGVRKKTNEPQFEDELYTLCESKGWDRRQHMVLQKVLLEYGIKDKFVTNASWEEVRASLKAGKPCIISAKFTRSGHIVVVTGFNDKGFYLNDPWGKYVKHPYVYELSNQPNHFVTLEALQQITYGPSPDTTWCHFPSRP